MKSLLKRSATIVALALVMTTVAGAQDDDGHGGHGGGHEDHGVALKYGRYKGKLRVPARKGQLNAVLDLFFVQEHDEYPKLKGILKVSVGGFQSPEYLTYVYEKVLFDPDKKTLTFDADTEDILLTDVMVHRDMLMGNYRVQSAGAEGSFTFDFNRSFDLPAESPSPSDPPQGVRGRSTSTGGTSVTIPSLAGEYVGRCGGRQVRLQLDTRRGRKGAGLGSNPFNQYEITGRLGEMSEMLGSIKSVIYREGTYDPFSGFLSLSGEPESLQCQVDTNGNLKCSACQLSRKTSFEQLVGFSADLPNHKRAFQLPRQGHPVFTDEPEAERIKGTYSGFLHHERSGLYQSVNLHLNAYSYSDRMHAPNQLYVTGQFELGFDSASESEKVVYRLEKRPWLFSNGAMVLKGNGDGFGVVREWRDGLLIVDWYSTIFGRVGTMELVREQKAKLPLGLGLVKGLSGSYVGPIYHLNLSLSSVANADDQPYNPYRLLKISGGTRVGGTGPFNEIKGGVYDYYSGVVALDSKEGTYYIGRVERDRFKLFITGYNAVTYPMLPFELGVYRDKQ